MGHPKLFVRAYQLGTEVTMGTIAINNLKVFAHHGVFPEETERGQDFYVSAKLTTDTLTASLTDDLSKTVNYGEVCHFIHDYLTKNTFKLIETAANRLADEVLKEFPAIDEITLEIKKPDAPIALDFDYVSVEVTRKYHTVYLSIGSNLGDKKGHLDFAVFALGREKGTSVTAKSSYKETAPVGYLDQPYFLNAALRIRTILSPEELLAKVQAIELEDKRERELRWGPRTLDIDIIYYDDLIYQSDTLCIPHLRMHERNFVLSPLCEIAPNVVHPILQKNTKMLREKLHKEKLSEVGI